MEKPSLTYNSDIEYLLNPLISYKNNNHKKILKSDIKFYRKRILGLTKDILYNKETICGDTLIHSSFNDYLFICIQYFKSLDTNDIIQNDMSFNVIKDDDVNVDEDFDDLIKKKSFKKITMDNFINKKKPQEIKVLPMKKKVDITDPELKKKGVKIKNTNQENIVL